MRERAQPPIGWSPWTCKGRYVYHDGGNPVAEAMGPRNAEHIASWHPAVALAVADLLEAAVGEFWDGEPQWTDCPVAQRAVAIARAYLGEVSDAS